MTDAPTVPTRKDAARNRARLLAAAQELFCATTDVTLKDVARHAGVGVGTVYRHFPTKDDLFVAMSAERLNEAVEIARAAAAEADGWRGLVRFLEESMELQAQNGCLRGLVGVGELSGPMVDEAREAIAPLVREMVTKAQEQGSLRPDFDPVDVTYLQIALLAVLDATRGAGPDRYRHHLALALDGMRTNGADRHGAS